MAAQADITPRSFAVRPELLAFGAIAAVTLWRVVWLWFDATTLSTDEAQYWFWGQEFAFGAYSKPPLIGWLIRVFTEIAGQNVFAVRLAAPLLHGVTALLIYALARRLAPNVAVFAAVSYVTLPSVALGSVLITTDTPLLVFAAAALLMQHRLAKSRKLSTAIALGALIGLGFLAKYAMIYVVLGMGAAAMIAPDWRISGRAAALAALIACAVLLPNLIWISSHRFVTFQHVASDAEWQGVQLYPLQALRFGAEQFAVMGPVLFAAWLLGSARLPRLGRSHQALFAASALPLIIVMIQALTSRALANWGVTFVITGVIFAALVLQKSRLMMGLSLCLTLVISLGLPVVMALGSDWRMPDGRLALRRYLGQPDVIDWSIAQAQSAQAKAIVAQDRDLLAALSWGARDSAVTVKAPPSTAAPQHHWDLLHQINAEDQGPIMLLAREGTALANQCPQGNLQRRVAGPGYLEGQTYVLIQIDGASCLKEKAQE